MANGWLNFSIWGDIAVTLGLMHITIMAVTLYLHRCQSHRAVTFHPIASHFFRFWLWLTTAMVTKEWVAIHRKHHATTETESDPHSPQIHGIKKVLFEGTELYREEAKNPETLENYSHGTPNDWIERHVYQRYNTLGIIIMLGIDLFLFGFLGLTIWAIQMMTIPFFAAGVINGIGHYWGYRNYECPDASRNIIPWGIFLCGEELHNNHHTYATSAKFSSKAWEFDIGYLYIRILAFFRLAIIKRLPPQLSLNKDKTNVDIDTLKAVLNNRFQIMASYTRDVIKPVVKEEKRRAGRAGKQFFKQAKKILIREESILTAPMKARLQILLEYRSQIRLVYQYRKRLQTIWSRRSLSQKELVESLQQWCQQAEATRIEVLQNFAKQLRLYA